MPIFEFVCNECEQPFEDLIFGNDTKGVICPACGSEQVMKKDALRKRPPHPTLTNAR